jgi:hypothetical protein
MLRKRWIRVAASASLAVCGIVCVACVETAAPRSRLASSAADSGSLFADGEDFGPARPANGASLPARDSGAPTARVLPPSSDGRGQAGARALGAAAGPASGGRADAAPAADGGEGDVSSVARNSNGTAADGGSSVGVMPADVGALVISELMVDPKALSDAEGEWFELYNPGTELLDLAGCTIADGSAQRHAIAAHVGLPPKGFASVARGDQPGFVPGIVSTFSLKNGSDVLELVCGGVTIDRVEYDKTSGFPVAAGVAMSLDARSLNAVANDVGASWCLAVRGYGADLGTPGKPNPACRGEDDGGVTSDGGDLELEFDYRDP